YPDRLGGPVCAAAAGERGGAHRGGEQAAPEAERSLDEDGVRGGGGASGILQGADELLPARGGGVRAELRERGAGRGRGRRARRLRTLPGLGSGTGFGGGGGGDQAGAEHRAQGELERDGQRWGFLGGAGGEGAAAGGGGADGRRRVRGGAGCNCATGGADGTVLQRGAGERPGPEAAGGAAVAARGHGAAAVSHRGFRRIIIPHARIRAPIRPGFEIPAPDGDRGDRAAAAASVSLPDAGPHRRVRTGEADCGDQERDDQRAVFP